MFTGKGAKKDQKPEGPVYTTPSVCPCSPSARWVDGESRSQRHGEWATALPRSASSRRDLGLGEVWGTLSPLSISVASANWTGGQHNWPIARYRRKFHDRRLTLLLGLARAPAASKAWGPYLLMGYGRVLYAGVWATSGLGHRRTRRTLWGLCVWM